MNHKSMYFSTVQKKNQLVSREGDVVNHLSLL